jgi:hypothetical protein
MNSKTSFMISRKWADSAVEQIDCSAVSGSDISDFFSTAD